VTGDEATQDLDRTVERIAREAREASRLVAKASSQARTKAIRNVAARLSSGTASVGILEANRLDLEAGARAGLSSAMLDRLKLDEKRLAGMARALEEVAALPDPVGAVDKMWRRPNGLLVGKMRIPLGVILIVYESRPNVTTDAFSVCLRAGNAVILRGGSEAAHTNAALGALVAAGLEEAGLPRAAAQIVPTTDRAAIEALLKREDEIDLVIPRGGEGLIRFVAERSRIPVIKHYKGVCHVYVDAAADDEMALAICENGKVQRPGVCNAVETILVHEAVAARFVPKLVARLPQVEIRGDSAARALSDKIKPATEDDWSAEYLDLIVALRVVPSMDAAIAHIERYGSNHTEAIVTRDYAASQRFVNEVGSSTVCVNASTRFADGGELGLGAEIGISTTRLHAYGPMGADELTTTKFVVFGDGQVRT
jgi:glutamate-5-semialdehyde dehydrogenase